jgi:hypothetical protein
MEEASVNNTNDRLDKAWMEKRRLKTLQKVQKRKILV